MSRLPQKAPFSGVTDSIIKMAGQKGMTEKLQKHCLLYLLISEWFARASPRGQKKRKGEWQFTQSCDLFSYDPLDFADEGNFPSEGQIRRKQYVVAVINEKLVWVDLISNVQLCAQFMGDRASSCQDLKRSMAISLGKDMTWRKAGR